VVHQGDVDGEFAVAADEFLGAVQRVDQPERAPTASASPRAAISSATTGMCGASARSAGTIRASARSSASVTGEASPLVRTVRRFA
jgi:hypothetical protein